MISSLDRPVRTRADAILDRCLELLVSIDARYSLDADDPRKRDDARQARNLVAAIREHRRSGP